MSSESFALSENDWKRLLQRISDGKCTPFLGAGACIGLLPTGGTIAEQWAADHDYPLDDKSNLIHVATYLAVQNDPLFPKEEFVTSWLTDLTYETLIKPDCPHSVLAALPLPIYITTNYDNFMVEALKMAGKSPRREICRWNDFLLRKLRNTPSVFADATYQPDAEHPVVFHLHGSDEMYESLVLTEDDYIHFLMRMSVGNDNPLPPRIQEAIAETSLLFIGYGLADIDFQVLFRGIINSVERISARNSFTLQFPKPEDDSKRQYLEKYFATMHIKVVWGDARKFTTELRQRWETFTHDK